MTKQAILQAWQSATAAQLHLIEALSGEMATSAMVGKALNDANARIAALEKQAAQAAEKKAARKAARKTKPKPRGEPAQNGDARKET